MGSEAEEQSPSPSTGLEAVQEEGGDDNKAVQEEEEGGTNGDASSPRALENQSLRETVKSQAAEIEALKKQLAEKGDFTVEQPVAVQQQQSSVRTARSADRSSIKSASTTASLEVVQQEGDHSEIDREDLENSVQAKMSSRRLHQSENGVHGALGVSFSAAASGGGGASSANRSNTLPVRGMARQKSMRKGKVDHVEKLARRRRASIQYMETNLGLAHGQLAHAPSSLAGDSEFEVSALHLEDLDEKAKEKLERETKFMKRVMDIQQEYRDAGIVTNDRSRSIEVRMDGFTYTVPVNDDGTVDDIVGAEKVFKIYKRARRIRIKKNKDNGLLRVSRRFSSGYVAPTTERSLLKDIDLVLRPGHCYLVLGPPGAGKTTLLRAISSLLPTAQRGPSVKGYVRYNGLSYVNRQRVLLKNAIAFIDQIDRHAPRLSVKETFDFAFQCKGGTDRSPIMEGDEEAIRRVTEKHDKEGLRVALCMEGLGLAHVADTFVGSTEVRGVSGGQRRRVTVGEMLIMGNPILCGDEISTGLDAASTYDIVNILSQLCKIHNYTRILSLLQPSPETFSLFDEVIIMAEGYVIYAGPILDAVPYFHGLGFQVPEHMDDADFLQAVATPDGADFYEGPGACPSPMTLGLRFKESVHGETIKQRLDSPLSYDWTKEGAVMTTRHAPHPDKGGPDVEANGGKDDIEAGDGKFDCNTKNCEKGVKLYEKQYEIRFGRAVFLNTRRFFTLWKRDTRFVRANFIKNVVMGISVGLVFLQTTIVESILGVLFQSSLFIMLGAMTAAPSQVEERAVYYKHRDANMYPTLSFVLGRVFAYMPQTILDISTFGTIIYFVVGLELAAANFFIFYAILIVFTLVMNTMLSACAAVAPSSSAVQAMSAVIILFNMLFCGFFVPPNTIPVYYTWLYWLCPLAWAFRGLVLNQFLSDSYSQEIGDTGVTRGENILYTTGFTLNGEPYTREWIGLSFAYMLPYCILMIVLNGIGLRFLRYESGKTSGGGEGDSDAAKGGDLSPPDGSMQNEEFDLSFKPVDLTFKDVCYEVKASTGGDILKLLNEVNGRFRPGRMCALMGSSGAGKTTLMDVIALRKTSGTITGEVRLNGRMQEEMTFRRCSGYVEQFDVQTPQLTVRETIVFSAELRLDTRHDPMLQDKANVHKFVDQVIDMLELRSLEDTLVGDDESGGLSFEQRKRLSIAVELAASPSVIFLDEPTSGLDSRAALIVVKSLKKIASTGRTVCATIHQPSSAVFEMFDDLLLMKKGGNVCYCGELGKNSVQLVDYFESNGGEPMNRGENPATWMLNVITKESVGDEVVTDYAQVYLESDDRKKLQEEIDEVTSSAKPENYITFDTTYAASARTRHVLMRNRLKLIYWRSPSYNRSRLLLSLLIAFLLASVFLSNRRPQYMSEQEISGVFATIFLSFIIIGILSLTSVLPVMLKIRDVFYRHRAAGMMNHMPLTIALEAAEMPFILISGTFFCCVFYFAIGLDVNFGKFAAFWGFFTFNIGINSYFGQSFMCLVRGVTTAGILCSVLIGMNNFFSGLIVRPQYLTGFWQAPYWITPGRYVYEGMMASQFEDDTRTVFASPGSTFYDYLNCANQTIWPDDGPECNGTVSEYFGVFFGWRFRRSNIPINAGVLGGIMLLARLLTLVALKFLNYTST